MNKQVVNVPKGIQFLSDWKEFNLPNHPHILNKQITGCGFTQWALTCPMNIILCSPRRILLENKEDQYLEELSKGYDFSYKIFYARNEYEKILDVGKDLNREDKSLGAMDNPVPVEYTKFYKDTILNFYRSCQPISSNQGFKFCKILVTYDSYRKVKEALESIGAFNYFYTIVDEMQSIFVDSKFKADTELEFVSALGSVQNLCYVSATPMLDKYLDMLDEFKDLPYYELDWSAEELGRVRKPKINPTPCSRITQKAIEIIEKYRTGNWKDSDNAAIRYKDDSGNIHEFWSKEAVFYINSVRNICDIIKKAELKQEECNILCADTPENIKKIRLAFGIKPKEFQGLGRVPRKSEMDKNKMFTFCTRTVYLGADFWSTNARSFVFSDSNVDCLAVDITMDLPQILGRQRNDDNPWKNELNIFFKPTIDKNIISKEDFDRFIEQKKELTFDKLRGLENSANDYRAQIAILKSYETDVRVNKYKDNYVSINSHNGSNMVAVFNNLVMVSEMRAFDIQQIDYADRCSVRNSINSQLLLNENKELTLFLMEYDKCTNFLSKMKLTCEFCKVSDETLINEALIRIDEQVANYIRVLGIERIESHSYIRIRLDRELSKQLNNQNIDLSDEVYKLFVVGERYTNKFIKESLRDMYSIMGYKKTPKASDLSSWFEVRPVNYLHNGIKVNGLELVRKLL